MSYTALYRKWRPDNFADVKGQDHVVTTLKNQITADRVGHAYLFCGTRGTGKTTIAKILAKAVNCEHPVDGNPCGTCPICKSISNGSSLNVIEIDAASNNGVDNIRQIREEVSYRPTEGRFKVYIIDEVHMLSTGAFNALLKTLEEPPSYVMFILATTEAHKIPVTILSRCQRYDLKRITVETITERLMELTAAEGVSVEVPALRYIAKMADGAMRDALSLLDQCMSYHMDRALRYEDVLDVLGTVDTEVFSQMLRCVVNSDVPGLMKALEEMILQGRDLSQFVSDFTWYLRNLLLVKTSPESENMIDLSSENMDNLKQEAVMLETEGIMRYIRVLSDLTAALKYATSKRIQVEVALIKMTKPQMETDVTSITERLRKLESLVKGREELFALTALRPQAGNTVIVQQEQSTQTKTVARPVIAALPEDLKEVAKNWKGIVGQAEPMYENFLKSCRITAEGDRLLLVTDNAFTHSFLSTEKAVASLSSTIEKTIGKKVELVVQFIGGETTFDDTFTDIEEYVKMDIAVEED